MVDRSLILQLLQLIGLALPAIGIYMQIVFADSRPGDDASDIVREGVYHMARLSVISLLFSAIILLFLLIAVLPGDFPEFFNLVGNVHDVLYNHRETLTIGYYILFVISLLSLYHEVPLRNRKSWNRMKLIWLFVLFVMPLFINSPVATIVILPIAFGFILFAGVVAFEYSGRETQTSINWGPSEYCNHLIGRFIPLYSDGNRFLPAPNGERGSSWVIIHRDGFSNVESKQIEVDGERFRIERLSE